MTPGPRRTRQLQVGAVRDEQVLRLDVAVEDAVPAEHREKKAGTGGADSGVADTTLLRSSLT
jgi:hypothetical protein